LKTYSCRINNKENRRVLKVTPEAMKVLYNCYWPGNVRELENCIERTATMAQGDLIRDASFPCRHNRCLTQTLHFVAKEDAVAPASASAPTSSEAMVEEADHAGSDAEVVRIGPTAHLATPPRQFGNAPPSGERERLIWALEQCGWVQAKAARLLKVTPRQLGYALQKHHIEVQKL
jgi:Nif-specific regulatory protein